MTNGKLEAGFVIPENERVFHFMGEPDNLRPVLLALGSAIASPSWSTYRGVGSTNYMLTGAKNGENQHFDDIDHLTLSCLH
jgi:4-deoxy-L-threo-5-hexosulose-uronate ketol-isomerase